MEKTIESAMKYNDEDIITTFQKAIDYHDECIQMFLQNKSELIRIASQFEHKLTPIQVRQLDRSLDEIIYLLNEKHEVNDEIIKLINEYYEETDEKESKLHLYSLFVIAIIALLLLKRISKKYEYTYYTNDYSFY